MVSRTWRGVGSLRIQILVSAILGSLSDSGEVIVKIRKGTLCGSMSFPLAPAGEHFENTKFSYCFSSIIHWADI